MKVLVFSPGDGSIWHIPAKYVAEHRAKHFAAIDSLQTCGDEFNKAFKPEVEYALANPDELIDWAQNSMDWTDVFGVVARMIEEPIYDYQEDWVNGQMEVKEVG
jgi:hypothetical protein